MEKSLNSTNMTETISGQIDKFLEYCEIDKNLSPGTVKLYRYYLRRFTGWFESQGLKDINYKDLTQDLIRKYRLYLSHYVHPVKGPLKRNTQTYFLIAIRAFLRHLARSGIKAISPEQIELGKTRDRSVKFLSEEQLRRLLNAPAIDNLAGLRNKTILEMLFSTGLRVSELVKLNRDNINLTTREFSVIGKGGKARIVFLSERAVFWLKRYLDAREDKFVPIFIRHKGKLNPVSNGEKMRLSVRMVEVIVDTYARRSGIPIKIGPHILRHTFATDLLSSGADLRSVQELLGHTNVATTQIYTHVTNPQLKQTYERFHSGNKKL